MEDNLKEYRDAVESFASQGKDYVIRNNGAAHALIILENLFSNAKETIRIAAGSLCDDEVVDTERYINAMKSFLKKPNTHLKIFLTDFLDKDGYNKQLCFLRELANSDAYLNDRVQIKDGQGVAFTMTVDSNEKKFIHFTTADEKMYRLETDINQRSALCNFCDKKMVKKLDDIFDKAFSENGNLVNLKEVFKTA